MAPDPAAFLMVLVGVYKVAVGEVEMTLQGASSSASAAQAMERHTAQGSRLHTITTDIQLDST